VPSHIIAASSPFPTSEFGREKMIHCAYMPSDDEKWMFAVFTDDRGEMCESAVFSVVPNAPLRFVFQRVLSFSRQLIPDEDNWGITIAKFGTMTTEEMADWSSIISEASSSSPWKFFLLSLQVNRKIQFTNLPTAKLSKGRKQQTKHPFSLSFSLSI
jgi:hypothetical protein